MAKLKRVILIGETNAGKSALFNALLGQPRAIVSDVPGTTTDEVRKATELLPYGPVTLIDTGGLFDADNALGAAREKKTRALLDTADAALYVIDSSCFDPARSNEITALLKEKELPFITVLAKADIKTVNYENAVSVSIDNPESIIKLRFDLANLLEAQTKKEESLIGGILAAGNVALLIAPIDDAAPVGRLILPQVQFIRDCLDNGDFLGTGFF